MLDNLVLARVLSEIRRTDILRAYQSAAAPLLIGVHYSSSAA